MIKFIRNQVIAKRKLILTGFWLNLLLFSSASAEDVSGTLINPLQSNSIADLINNIAGIATDIGLPVAAFFIIWAGFLFATARGNEEQLKKAKNTFKWTIIGTVVLLGARVLADAISEFVQEL